MKKIRWHVVTNVVIAIVFVFVGFVGGFYIAPDAEIPYLFPIDPKTPEIESVEDVKDVLKRKDGYEILTNVFVHGEPLEDDELTRYALNKIYEGGGNPYAYSLSGQSVLHHDPECRVLYFNIFRQELNGWMDSISSEAKSLHRVENPELKQAKINLIIDYLGLDREQYNKIRYDKDYDPNPEDEFTKDQIWLIQQVESIRDGFKESKGSGEINLH